jgi:hypothetical protein
MRKLILATLLIFITFTASSQILISLLLGDKLNSDKLEFGLEGGMNWSMINGLDAKTYRSTFNLGFYFDFKFNSHWGVSTGVLVKANNGVYNLSENDLKIAQVDSIGSIGTYSQVVNSFMVPFLLKYRFKNYMFIEFGPQFGLMYKSWVLYESEKDDKVEAIKQYNKDVINKIDAGMTLGMGYKFLQGKGWTLGGKYYYGFVNVYHGVSGTQNSAFYLTLKIPIGVGKKEDVKLPPVIMSEKEKAKLEKKEAKKAAKQKKKEEKNSEK